MGATVGSYFNHLRSKPSLMFSILGAILSGLGVLLSLVGLCSARVSPWTALVILIAGSVLMTVALVRLLLPPVRGSRLDERYLSPDQAPDLVYRAVDPVLPRPLCRQPATTHACGTGIAATTGKGFTECLDGVVSVVNAVALEMRQEREFSKRSVLKHIEHALSLHDMFLVLACHPGATIWFSLPKGQAIGDHLLNSANYVKQKAIDTLKRFLLDIPAAIAWEAEPNEYRERIRQMITVEVPNSLEALRGSGWLRESIRLTHEMARDLTQDWQRDAEDIRRDDLCSAVWGQ